MSATIVCFMLAIRLFVSNGLNIDMKRELFYQGRDLFCAQLQCTENIREDTQISALVNMSIYVINEPGEKLMSASVSGSDSKARDYKLPGVFVDGKLSHHGGELHLFLSNDSACHEKTLKCEIYFTYKTGEIGFAEEEIAPLRKEHMRKSDLLLSLKAKTVNYVKTVDTMADFLKSFEDPNKLKGADMSMSLQMSHLNSDDNGFPRKIVTDTHKQIESFNGLQNLETRLNNQTEQLKFVNERFNNLKDKPLNTTEQNSEKEQNTNSLIWTKEMCKRTHNFNVTSRQLVQLNHTKLTFCDTKTDDGGWILIQGYTELRVDLDIGKTRQYAEYSNFKVDNEAAKYKMSFSSFRGNATDNLGYHIGMKFSTIDSDNDGSISRNCAQEYKGGWWYQECLYSNLNGIWNVSGAKGVYWQQDVKSVEMKLRKI